MRIEEVRTPRFLYTHRGLLLTDQLGRQRVYANCFGRGVARQTLEEFADGRPATVMQSVTTLTPHEIVARAESAVGVHQYDAIRWNCDHFVTWVLGKQVESVQLQAYTFVAAAIGVGLLIAGSKGKVAILA